MDFISNKEPQIQAMLKSLGIEKIEDLFLAIPDDLKLSSPEIDDGLSEFEGMCLVEGIGKKNTFPSMQNYLGAGAYEHHVPALVNAMCSKSEFLTSYTPYQAEASQGMLQIIFEFQSSICALTGLDAANASLYDGATACAEAVLMALRLNKDRPKVLIADSLHPHYKAVVEQYLASHQIEEISIPFLSDGTLDKKRLEGLMDGKTAALLIQNPNFFGIVEDLKSIFSTARNKGIINILCANPMAYGLFASAGELGADIAVGDGQPFGLPLHFGGPYVGYMACRQEYLRQLPGRLVGETVDTKGRRGFVLTLQAREQHIRREKATSNICTNQALAALACLIGILWYGKKGVAKLALTNYQRAAYLKNQLSQIKKISAFNAGPHFNEFVIKFEMPLEQVLEVFRSKNIEPGVDLGRFFPSLHQHLLICVTETKSKDQLDTYIQIAKEVCA